MVNPKPDIQQMPSISNVPQTSEDLLRSPTRKSILEQRPVDDISDFSQPQFRDAIGAFPRSKNQAEQKIAYGEKPAIALTLSSFIANRCFLANESYYQTVLSEEEIASCVNRTTQDEKYYNMCVTLLSIAVDDGKNAADIAVDMGADLRVLLQKPEDPNRVLCSFSSTADMATADCIIDTAHDWIKNIDTDPATRRCMFKNFMSRFSLTAGWDKTIDDEQNLTTMRDKYKRSVIQNVILNLMCKLDLATKMDATDKETSAKLMDFIEGEAGKLKIQPRDLRRSNSRLQTLLQSCDLSVAQKVPSKSSLMLQKAQMNGVRQHIVGDIQKGKAINQDGKSKGAKKGHFLMALSACKGDFQKQHYAPYLTFADKQQLRLCFTTDQVENLLAFYQRQEEFATNQAGTREIITALEGMAQIDEDEEEPEESVDEGGHE